MRLKFYVIEIILLLVTSCSSPDMPVKHFPEKVHLTAAVIPINEIVKMGNIYKTENYFIIRDVQPNAKYNFYVYSFPSFHFLYSFAPVGNGPEEYLMPTVIKNMPGDVFAFRDHATDRFVSYQLTDSCAAKLDEFHFSETDGRFCWEINYIDSNLYIVKRSNSRLSTRELWNIKQKERLDTLPNTFNLLADLGDDYYTEFDDVWISACGNKFASAYYFIDRIELGEIRGNKFYATKAIGTNIPPKFYLFNRKNWKSKYKYNVDNNVVHYEDLKCTEFNIYGLYAGIPWGDVETKHSSVIEVYDWQGNPVKLYLLDKNISTFIVDEVHECIYGINMEQCEDAILKFPYNLGS